MNERGRWLSGVGTVAVVLLTGCSRSVTDYPVCPKDKEQVADNIGGRPEDWETLGDRLWGYRGTERVFVGREVGKVLIYTSDGVPKVLSPGQEATVEEAIFRCTPYDEQNLQPTRNKTYRQSSEAIQQPSQPLRK